jgi:hypothetical protein
MTQSADWFEAMAKAMKVREKCLNAIERWTAALNEAEAKIKELGAQAGADVPEPQVPGLAPDYADSAE